jgi:hypothetical protein
MDTDCVRFFFCIRSMDVAVLFTFSFPVRCDAKRWRFRDDGSRRYPLIDPLYLFPFRCVVFVYERGLNDLLGYDE